MTGTSLFSPDSIPRTVFQVFHRVGFALAHVAMIEPVIPFETARFTMRGLRRSDAADLFPTLGDEAHCLHLTRPAFASEEALWDWLAEPGWNGLTWIAEDSDGEVAGRFVAVPQEEPGVHEIGYITCAHRQRDGVARECTAALIDHLFGEYGAQAITAEIDADNEPSVRLAQALGFRREALHLAYEETHKGMCDVAFYRLSRAGHRALREQSET